MIGLVQKPVTSDLSYGAKRKISRCQPTNEGPLMLKKTKGSQFPLLLRAQNPFHLIERQHEGFTWTICGAG